MPIKFRFRGDKLKDLVRKWIVFPSDGSETRLVQMIPPKVTVEDIASLFLYGRCVDMRHTFSDTGEYSKTRFMGYLGRAFTPDNVESGYLFFYSLSRHLPVNLNVTNPIGVTLSHLKLKKQVFWRGDIVAMKVQLGPERPFVVESLEADISELVQVEQFLQKTYQVGTLEYVLCHEELLCEQYSRQSTLPLLSYISKVHDACTHL